MADVGGIGIEVKSVEAILEEGSWGNAFLTFLFIRYLHQSLTSKLFLYSASSLLNQSQQLSC